MIDCAAPTPTLIDTLASRGARRVVCRPGVHGNCVICCATWDGDARRTTCSQRCRRAKMIADRYIARMRGRVRTGVAMPYQTLNTSRVMREGVRFYIESRGGAK